MSKTRNLGLDMARVAAIALVWIGHSGFFSIGMNPKVMEFWGGSFCLEVFFALSGFLVGRSMILTVTSRDPGPAFKKFYINRLIRIIPLYYLVLLALWFITSQRPPLSCFLFLQNFSGEDLGYFPPSWSLPVEAWFYFLIPPVFFLLYRLFSRKQCDVSAWTDVVDVALGNASAYGLTSRGTVLAAGNNDARQCDVAGWKNITAISAGDSHVVGLKEDGTVVAQGWNGYGQCDVEFWEDIVAVSAGASHTVRLRSDGTVVAAGSNAYGQCDVGGWTDIVAVSAGTYHTLALCADGTLVAAGSNGWGQCNVNG